MPRWTTSTDAPTNPSVSAAAPVHAPPNVETGVTKSTEILAELPSGSTTVEPGWRGVEALTAVTDCKLCFELGKGTTRVSAINDWLCQHETVGSRGA
jgi:hypothetical protein